MRGRLRPCTSVISFTLTSSGDLSRAEEILDMLGPERPRKGNSKGNWMHYTAEHRSSWIPRIERHLDESAPDWREHLVIERTDIERNPPED